MIRMRNSTKRGKLVFALWSLQHMHYVFSFCPDCLNIWPHTGIQRVALVTTQAEWSGWCRARGRPITWPWLGGSSSGLGGPSMLQTKRMTWAVDRTCNRKYLTWTRWSSHWMSIITTGLVELVMSRQTALHFLRLASRLSLFLSFTLEVR